jgi:L-ascorbate metabolism protein UlaG (beta-lactamase superfamily)
MTFRHDGLAVSWLGYATARTEAPDGTVVYTDPGRYGVLDGTWAEQYGGAPHPSGDAYDARDGDVVLVTHDHHYDADGVRRVADEDATVLVYEGVTTDGETDTGRTVEVPESLPHDVRRVGYDETVTVAGVEVTAVPAYNRADGPRAGPDGEVAHPEGLGCGFVWTVGGVSCLWTGDSDVVPEQEALDVSLLFPSIAQSFTMNREEAAAFAETVDPDLVAPIHYNTFPDLRADSAAFAADVARRGVPVVLDENDEGL